MLTLSPADIDAIAIATAQKLLILQASEETKHITYSEAMSKLGIRHEALTRRLNDAGIPVYRFGKGKAFDRKYLSHLQ